MFNARPETIWLGIVLSTATPSSQDAPQHDLLQLGSQGEAVIQLQKYLYELGYYKGPIDGLFGPQTEAAVVEFQGDQGVESSGAVDPQTWSYLTQNLDSPYPLEIEPIAVPRLSLIQLTNTTPPPSPLWLVAMPLIPLVGGVLAFLKQTRQARHHS